MTNPEWNTEKQPQRNNMLKSKMQNLKTLRKIEGNFQNYSIVKLLNNFITVIHKEKINICTKL